MNQIETMQGCLLADPNMLGCTGPHSGGLVLLSLLLMLATLVFFAWVGYRAAKGKTLDEDSYISARGTQGSLRIGLSLFASGMGIWLLFGPPEVGYYGGFFDVLGYALSAAIPFLLLAYLGPMIRSRLPMGVTLADYVHSRVGRPMQVYVGLISILYMFTFLFAEFTAIGKAMDFLFGYPPLIAILPVAIFTAAYTAYGGLPASLQTDRWQAWAIIWLLAITLTTIFASDIGDTISNAKAPGHWGPGGSITHVDFASFQSGLALVIAITAAEMFSQGNWQRNWASKDEESLRKGAWLAAALVFPLMLLMGFMGTVAAGQGPLDDPSTAFFWTMDPSPVLMLIFVVLVIALVCSSADTLQNAIIASISRDISNGSMSLRQARLATILLVPVAVYLAVTMQAASVFQIFLFADLLAAATVAPVFLLLWDNTQPNAALGGAVAGLLSVVAYGFATADLSTGIGYLTSPTNESGLANLEVFLSALIGSAVVTVAGSYTMSEEAA